MLGIEDGPSAGDRRGPDGQPGPSPASKTAGIEVRRLRASGRGPDDLRRRPARASGRRHRRLRPARRPVAAFWASSKGWTSGHHRGQVVRRRHRRQRPFAARHRRQRPFAAGIEGQLDVSGVPAAARTIDVHLAMLLGRSPITGIDDNGRSPRPGRQASFPSIGGHRGWTSQGQDDRPSTAARQVVRRLPASHRRLDVSGPPAAARTIDVHPQRRRGRARHRGTAGQLHRHDNGPHPSRFTWPCPSLAIAAARQILHQHRRRRPAALRGSRPAVGMLGIIEGLDVSASSRLDVLAADDRRSRWRPGRSPAASTTTAVRRGIEGQPQRRHVAAASRACPASTTTAVRRGIEGQPRPGRSTFTPAAGQVVRRLPASTTTAVRRGIEGQPRPGRSTFTWPCRRPGLSTFAGGRPGRFADCRHRQRPFAAGMLGIEGRPASFTGMTTAPHPSRFTWPRPSLAIAAARTASQVLHQHR